MNKTIYLESKGLLLITLSSKVTERKLSHSF